jgi:hypothetical protein
MATARDREEEPSAGRRANAPNRKPPEGPSGAHEEEDESRLMHLQGLIGNRAVAEMLGEPGTAVPAAERGSMEASFGRSFSDVRVHKGADVDEEAERLGAAAFTVGSDIYVHSKVADLDTATGRTILGEELAHVTQGVGAAGAARVLDPDDPAEQEAHEAGLAAASGERADVSPVPRAADAAGRVIMIPLLIAGAAYAGYKYLTEEEAVAASTKPEAISPKKKEHIQSSLIEPLQALVGELSGLTVENTDALVAVKNRILSLQPVPGAVGGATVSSESNLRAFEDASVYIERAATVLATATGTVDEGVKQAISKIDAAVGAYSGLPVEPVHEPAAAGEAAREATGLSPAQKADLDATVVGPLNEAKAKLQASAPDTLGAVDDLTRAIKNDSSFKDAQKLPPAVRSRMLGAADQLRLAGIIVQTVLNPNAAITTAARYLQSAIDALNSIPVEAETGAGAATPAPAAAPPPE